MKIPKVTAIVTVSLVALSFLNLILKSYTYFVLIINKTHDPAGTSQTSTIAQETGDLEHPHSVFVPLLTFIPTKSSVILRPWVLITSGLIATGFWGFISSVLHILFLGRYVETLWGTHEYSKFIIYVTVVTNFTLYLYYSMKSFFFRGYIPPEVKGAMPLIMGLLVAVKQRISKHYIIFLQGRIRIRVTYIPILAITIVFIASCIDHDFNISLSSSIASLIISWIYLRFLKLGANERHSFLLPLALTKRKQKQKQMQMQMQMQQQQHHHQQHQKIKSNSLSNSTVNIIPNHNIRGDRSCQFEFATFFPRPISGLVSIVSSIIFRVFIKYKLLNKNDFGDYEEDELDIDTSSFEMVNNLQSSLFDLSPLKGAQKVETIPNGTSEKLKNIWKWIVKTAPKSSIKFNMEKRRKLALKELD